MAKLQINDEWKFVWGRGKKIFEKHKLSLRSVYLCKEFSLPILEIDAIQFVRFSPAIIDCQSKEKEEDDKKNYV
jgi:hypothetical protein